MGIVAPGSDSCGCWVFGDAGTMLQQSPLRAWIVFRLNPNRKCWKKTPVAVATNKRFTYRQIGIGSFDDTADWDNIELCGVRVQGTETETDPSTVTGGEEK